MDILNEYENNLIDRIESSFQNRQKELIDFLNLLHDSDKKKYEKILDTLYKAYILLLYAHWEGFIKETVYGYFTFIVSNKKTINELKENFYNIYFKTLLKSYKVGRNINTEKNLLKCILDKNKKFKLELDDQYVKNYIIAINDNLKIKNYTNICNLLNYEYKDEFGLFERTLKKLVDNRNAIAHTGIGAVENLYSGLEDIEQMNCYILKEMEKFKDYIVNNIRNREFLIVSMHNT